MARICVFCASSEAIATKYVELGAEVGAAIAARGHSLISGGGSISAMVHLPAPPGPVALTPPG
nr:hypothetical protein [Sporichthya sp.]